ncbi:ImmA/IrrE family metallo-endopeptidase [Sedimentitalea sp. JM2-8]|uniref:ImmA/IrrE family metallo-endopeptidase n=1 Tax=Sedimentitalea xiamensis TaxID=3050037 RepID=A0ABT7FK12_9RHOB|nr:ImmA/IrrE family metallo-endopeptidase [Sedimentitalea xiamensis]MDK3075496.1 ImmA/IrrE family metallo-endopeptidase [Sedimentitalea xiamensis]
MTTRKSPQRWANDLTIILNARGGDDRFPVNVEQLAYDYSRQRFPDDPVSLVKGASLKGFEGALMKAPPGEKGWGIFYNSDTASAGRINFTLAHEFGHYLLHRQEHPDGIQCSTDDMERWDSEYRKIEKEANEFAANLLMPLDDFRRQIDPRRKPDLEALGECADRYGVSLIAAILRWLQYTGRRAVLVKSIDGFIHWAWSSDSAWRSGLYFKTSGRPPLEIPSSSVPATGEGLVRQKATVEHDARVWFKEPCIEHALVSEVHDFALSLLLFGDAPSRFELAEEIEEDSYDRMLSRTPGSSWLG